MLDPETQKIATSSEKLKLMLEHDGWGVARSLLSEKILDLQMIGDVVDLTPEAMAVQVKAKKLAAEILFSWLTNDIEGTVAQHINNNIPTKPKQSYLVNEK